jgi:hypothetical protein
VSGRLVVRRRVDDPSPFAVLVAGVLVLIASHTHRSSSVVRGFAYPYRVSLNSTTREADDLFPTFTDRSAYVRIGP